MTTERKRRSFTPEFRTDGVALVAEQGCSIAKAAQAVGNSENKLRCWRKALDQGTGGARPNGKERTELARLRQENKELRI